MNAKLTAITSEIQNRESQAMLLRDRERALAVQLNRTRTEMSVNSQRLAQLREQADVELPPIEMGGE